MPEQINWTINVQVVGGPKVSASDTLEVEAYDKIEAIVPANGSVKVDVQPGTGAQILLITAGSYENITYKVVSGSGSNSAVILDGPHILIGAGAVGLLGGTQKQFEFTNNGSDEVVVDVLVGRDATPSS